MSTRAITLVPLRDMTSSSLINALIKIFSHFPSLKNLFSDNGSNFRDADREIKNAIYEWEQKGIDLELEKINLVWNFGPAYCGQAGGAWECLIGLSKKLLKSVIGTKNVDYDDFETLLSGASYMMNRRPLTPVSNDVNDNQILTPAHFLYPYLFVNKMHHLLPPQADPYDSFKHGWRSSQYLIDRFWEEYKNNYIAHLIKRNKKKQARSMPAS